MYLTNEVAFIDKSILYVFKLPDILFNKRQRIPKGQSKMDNPEKLATQITEDEEKQQKHNTICF